MSRTILVLGATGTQGGAVAVALLAAGFDVRALVPPGPADALESARLASRGVRIVPGDLDHEGSLREAVLGVDGVFSVQPVDATGKHAEVAQAARLFAAMDGRVPTLVQSVVSGTGTHESMPGWAEGRWWRPYWEDKAAVRERARVAAPHVTVLQPAMMMENFLRPKSHYMHPELAHGVIATAARIDRPFAFAAASSIAAAAVAAFREPERFHGLDLELADERLTLREVGAAISKVVRRTVTVEQVDPSTLVGRGHLQSVVDSQTWLDVVGYPADPVAMRSVGLTPLLFASWAERNAAGLVESTSSAPG